MSATCYAYTELDSGHRTIRIVTNSGAGTQPNTDGDPKSGLRERDTMNRHRSLADELDTITN